MRIIEEATPYTLRLMKPFGLVDRAVNYTSYKAVKPKDGQAGMPGIFQDILGDGDDVEYEWKHDKKEKQVPFWFAGGSVLSAVMNTEVNDYDVFSPEPDKIIEALNGNKLFKKTWEDPRVVNFHHEFGYKIQVVRRFQPISEEVTFKTFDFTVVCAAFDGKRFTCHDRFFEDVAQKRLVINEVHHPLSTFQRMLKYSRKGFDACPVGMMRVAKAIKELEIDWANPDQNVLEYYPDGTPRFPGVD